MDSGRKQDRKAVGLLVKLAHANVDTFAEEYATNLSPGGMFIRSKQPQPVGTKIQFEVQIAAGVRVMRGTAVVRWTRQPGDPAGAPGMGVQFEALDATTRALVDRMLASAQKSEEPDSAAELEAQLRAQYGDPGKGKAPASASVPAIAPVVPPIKPVAAPSIAPVVPPVAPAISPVAKPPEPAFSLDFELAEPSPPPPPPLESNLFGSSSGSEDVSIDIEPASEAAPANAVDLSLDQLIADTPSPDEDEPFALAPPTPSPTAPELGDVEIDIDYGSEGGDAAEDDPFSVAFGDDVPADAGQKASDARAAGGAAARDSRAAGTAAPAGPAKAAAQGQAARAGAEPSRSAAQPAAPERKAPAAPSAAPASAAASAPSRESRPAAPGGRRADVPAGPPPTLAKPAAAPAAPKVQAGPVFLKPAEQIDATGPVIGIDLGTTNSGVGILQNGKPIVMRSRQGYNTLPSVVALSSAGKVLVAHPAKNQLVLNPSRTIYGAKRLVGRAYDSPIVSQVKEHFHYDICADTSGRAAVRLGDNVLSLEEVQGLVLRECKEMAERELNRSVSRAVITVPAYYSESQREAVRKAGAMAGLKVERILNEPTAAALAFGMNRELDRKVLVYDLGGGTFDATVLKIEKNVFEVLATGGDTFLGGTDFDNAITDLLLQKFEQTEGVPLNADPIALSRVSELSEKAKCALSERSSFDVHIPMLMMDPNGGASRDLRCTLTRKEVEDATRALVERTLDVVRDVLLDAKLQAREIDDIILVGGQSRMPLVREKLHELFGKPAQAGVNADEAVALGAALYSGSLDKVSSVVLIDVLPMTIGVAMSGGAFKRVLERNTPLPAQRSFTLPTGADNATAIEFQVFQGEDNNVAGNEYLGTVRVEGLPKAAKGAVKVAVTLRLDAECVLHVDAVEFSSRKTVQATLATRYTPDQVQQKLGIAADQVKKANAKRAEELSARAGGFWGKLKRLVGRA